MALSIFSSEKRVSLSLGVLLTGVILIALLNVGLHILIITLGIDYPENGDMKAAVTDALASYSGEELPYEYIPYVGGCRRSQGKLLRYLRRAWNHALAGIPLSLQPLR